jgi:hypothetical protein
VSFWTILAIVAFFITGPGVIIWIVLVSLADKRAEEKRQEKITKWMQAARDPNDRAQP